MAATAAEAASMSIVLLIMYFLPFVSPDDAGAHANARASGWIIRLAALNGDPSKRGEFLDARLAAEASVAGRLHAPERHLRLVVDRCAVDVADAALDLLRHLQRASDIAPEHCGGQPIFGVVGDRDCFID